MKTALRNSMYVAFLAATLCATVSCKDKNTEIDDSEMDTVAPMPDNTMDSDMDMDTETDTTMTDTVM
ncbi:hypothetical protein [Flavobacterium rhizosphaerae]|uniref:Uncharacterized protein n=1 Tax=Flavobacterium rhizosphaerae TaxID=3163298 RepID=A0ABW8YS84_9FLAO